MGFLHVIFLLMDVDTDVCAVYRHCTTAQLVVPINNGPVDASVEVSYVDLPTCIYFCFAGGLSAWHSLASSLVLCHTYVRSVGKQAGQ